MASRDGHPAYGAQSAILFWSVAFILASVPGTLVGCSAPATPLVSPDAAPEAVCGLASDAGWRAKPTKAASALVDTADCPFCVSLGHCKPVPGKACLPTPEGCAHSEHCAGHGLCGFVNGDCAYAPVDGGTCTDSPGCRFDGRCAAAVDGSCAATATDACRSSQMCRDWGDCTAHPVRQACEPATDADCASSLACRFDGACQFHQSTVGGNYCVASAASCAASLACLLAGNCVLAGDTCVSPVDHCAATLGCQLLGMCWSHDGQCTRGSASDCQNALACKQQGYCLLISGRSGCVRAADLYAPK